MATNDASPFSATGAAASTTPPKPPGAKKLRPVLHEPCSSTLAKYHDSINQSLTHEPITPSNVRPDSAKYRSSSTHNLSAATASNQTLSQHRILEAKQKYRYMVKTKTFVDESLFGPTTSRPSSANQWNAADLSSRNNYGAASNSNHLTHQLMSNMAPLIHTPPVRSGQNTERTDSARSNLRGEIGAGQLSQRPSSARRPPSGNVKPWRP